jgi:hypothetical protein
MNKGYNSSNGMLRRTTHEIWTHIISSQHASYVVDTSDLLSVTTKIKSHISGFMHK